ncbi:MAG: LacI family DNA-binding transcriptional regulator [Firmicutes bacterium]|uniref:LacI family DNA-binding transcriptional regulator n=1 Tax=Candidatus Onthovivens merdipullorum TaxID=2840889 RepID=A0A9D9DHX4_9BACL|nr:LacI family DNA-binding transcriptional regulator [Candidatus Onthovivens merdipullorum]
MDNLKERVTIYEVAKVSGVSLATVSRVINNASTVKPETKRKVLSVIKKLGYKPSGLAKALATNKTTNIGVIIPSANYVYIANMLNGITEVCKNKGFTVSLYTTSHSREDALNMIEKVIQSHVDGVIVFDDELNSEDLEVCSSYNVPVISVNNKIEASKIGSIHFGYEHLFKQIIKDYFNKGDKQMTFLHVHNAGRLLARIENVFIETHLESDREYNIMNCDDSYNRTYHDFMERFKNFKRKEYVVAYRDSIAAAVLNAASDSGLSIPGDIEVLSIIGTKYSAIIRPQISSMHIDMQEVGKRAVFMLIDLINDCLYDKVYKFDSVYIKRNSTRF